MDGAGPDRSGHAEAHDCGGELLLSGPAVVYDDANEALAAIRAGHVKPGAVLIVRGMGPKGGPGMAGPASMVVFALESVGLQHDVAFVTDGQLSGLCNQGLTVAEVSPEAAVGARSGWSKTATSFRSTWIGSCSRSTSTRMCSPSATHDVRGPDCREPRAIFRSISAPCGQCPPARCS